jgi:endo-1,4-beta-xylanase
MNTNNVEVGSVDIMELPPLKDAFKEYFLLGNIFDPQDASSETGINTAHLIRHYNILTAQNNMKPVFLSGSTPGTYNENGIATAKRMVNAARASGLKVYGHTLLWHSQLPSWQTDLPTNGTSKEDALKYMKEYITHIVTLFKGTLLGWDVLNEVFPDGVNENDDWKTIMRPKNPWNATIGSDFIYEGFLAARAADPSAILYYNDFNLDNKGKATIVHNMTRDVNARYAQEHPEANGRLLIEGIGMQSHYNTNVSVANVIATLDLFRTLGTEISVSELDILAQTWGDYEKKETPTTEGLINQANLYGQLFELYLQNSDIIKRVTFWGVADHQSWRGRGLPLPFDGQLKAKPGYYKIVGALTHTR